MKSIKYLTLGLLAGGLGIARAADSLVADPHRAIRNPGWANAEFAGRDYWQLYQHDALIAAMPEIADMPFFKDSGIFFFRPSNKDGSPGGMIERRGLIYSSIAVREIELTGASGENISPASKITVENPPAGSTNYNLACINDGDDWTTFQFRGPRDAVSMLKAPVLTLAINLAKPAKIAAIRLKHGAYNNVGMLQSASLSAESGGQWSAASCAVQNISRREMVLKPDTPLSSQNWRLLLKGYPYQVVFVDEAVPDRARLRAHPFVVQMAQCVGCVDSVSLEPENIDRESFSGFLKEFDRTNPGLMMNEWDSNMKNYIYSRPDSARIMPEYIRAYATKAQGRAAWEKFFKNWKKLLFDNVMAQSGGVSYSQYAAAWGARTVMMECSGMSPFLTVRAQLLATRGGARQFGIPWGFYQAFFYGMPQPSQVHPYDGKPYSQVRRELMASYYMGASFHWPEGDRLTLLQQKGDKVTLSINGETYRWFYEWHKSGKGARGESYTPILLLVDYDHGHSGRSWSPQYNDKCWDKIPFDDGDYMQEHFVRTVDPQPMSESSGMIIAPPYSNNLRNSRIGDICDFFFANPPQHGGAIKKEHLDRYPVAILLGNVKLNDALVERLKTYVREGGTLVLNSAQVKTGPLAESGFIGLRVTDETGRDSAVHDFYHPLDAKLAPQLKSERRHYSVAKVAVSTARVVRQSPSGLPLFLKNQYGKGNVIVTTPVYMLCEEKTKANPLIADLLEALQWEVMPVRISGDVEFLANKLAPDHWRITTLNNKGVLKHPMSPEVQVRSFKTDVLITAPAGVKAEELAQNAVLEVREGGGQTYVAFPLPPGEVRVIDLQDIQGQPLK